MTGPTHPLSSIFDGPDYRQSVDQGVPLAPSHEDLTHLNQMLRDLNDTITKVFVAEWQARMTPPWIESQTTTDANKAA